MCYVVKSEKLGIRTDFGAKVRVSSSNVEVCLGHYIKSEARPIAYRSIACLGSDDLECLAVIPGIAHHYDRSDE